MTHQVLRKAIRACGRVPHVLFRAVRIYLDPIAYARGIGVQVGKRARLLGIDGKTFGSEPFLISLGDHVTICDGVTFITHDGGVWVFRCAEPTIECFKPIAIGNNVFIGSRTILLPGCEIGDNVVVGAGSIVSGELVSNTVYAGIPAKKIKSVSKYRQDIEEFLSHRDWDSDVGRRSRILRNVSKYRE